MVCSVNMLILQKKVSLSLVAKKYIYIWMHVGGVETN